MTKLYYLVVQGNCAKVAIQALLRPPSLPADGEFVRAVQYEQRAGTTEVEGTDPI